MLEITTFIASASIICFEEWNAEITYCWYDLQKEVHEDLCNKAKEKIRHAVGVRHVIDLLASEKKLIVGHSCNLGLFKFLSSQNSNLHFLLLLYLLFFVQILHISSASSSGLFHLLWPNLHVLCMNASLISLIQKIYWRGMLLFRVWWIKNESHCLQYFLCSALNYQAPQAVTLPLVFSMWK